MGTFKSSPADLLAWLRPFFDDPLYHNLQINCDNGDVVSTSLLLFAPFLPQYVQRELSQIEQSSLDSPSCIILPDISSKDISKLISSIITAKTSFGVVDSKFLDKYFFCDVDLFKSRNQIETYADQNYLSSNGENVEPCSIFKEDGRSNFPDSNDELDAEESRILRPVKRNINDEDNDCPNNELNHEDVMESYDEEDQDIELEEAWTHEKSKNSKSAKREKKKKKISAVYAEFAEWDYSLKNGHCKVCNETFEKDPRRLQRHIERTHLGNYNKRKYERKMLLHELIKTEQSDGGLTVDSKAADEKTINEASAELGAIKDEEKRKKIQTKLDELTASGYKLGKTGRLYKKEQCAICGKTLCSKYALKKHEDAVHFNIRPFGCDICAKRFIMKNDLKDHITAVHKKIKSCVCDVCGLKLATQHGLRVHKLVHQDGTKCIKCLRCDKMFRHMCTYRRHVERMHDFTPDKRLKCEACGKFFNHREGLATHVKKFHTPQAVVFKCHLCSSAFAYRYERTKHLRRFHKLEKRVALAISADDIPPEVAATLTGDDNEEDSLDESADEATVKQQTKNHPGQKSKSSRNTGEASGTFASAEKASVENPPSTRSPSTDDRPKFRPTSQNQIQHQAFSSLLASSQQHLASASQNTHQSLLADPSAAQIQMAMGTLGGSHGFSHPLHFQRS